jgi:hypothetical protein
MTLNRKECRARDRRATKGTSRLTMMHWESIVRLGRERGSEPPALGILMVLTIPVLERSFFDTSLAKQRCTFNVDASVVLKATTESYQTRMPICPFGCI